MHESAAHTIDKARVSGASQQVIDETARQMQAFKPMYDPPVVNAAMTFMEPFPGRAHRRAGLGGRVEEEGRLTPLSAARLRNWHAAGGATAGPVVQPAPSQQVRGPGGRGTPFAQGT